MDLYRKELPFDSFDILCEGEVYRFPKGVLALDEDENIFVKGRYTHPFLLEHDEYDQKVSKGNLEGTPQEILRLVYSAMRQNCCHSMVPNPINRLSYQQFLLSKNCYSPRF